MSKTTAIAKLSPAAARLLLAFLSMSTYESYDEVTLRSGICDTLTLSQARQQLKALGFIVNGPNGEEVTLYARAEVPSEPPKGGSVLFSAKKK